MRALLSRIATLLIVAVTGAGCGGDGNGPSGVLTTVEVTPATATLFTVAPGNTAALKVVAKDQNGAVMSNAGTPTFSSDDEAVATVGDRWNDHGAGSRNGEHYGIADRRRRNQDGHHDGDGSRRAGERRVAATPALTFNPSTVDVQTARLPGRSEALPTTSRSPPQERPLMLQTAPGRIRSPHVSDQWQLRLSLHDSSADDRHRPRALMNPGSEPLSRRRFLHVAAAGAAALAGGSLAALSSCDPATGPDGEGTRSPLTMPATLSVTGASLIAAPGIARIATSESSSAWLFNGLLPGPTIRARQGEQAHIRLLNQLPEPTIVHWHGVLVPRRRTGIRGTRSTPARASITSFRSCSGRARSGTIPTPTS